MRERIEDLGRLAEILKQIRESRVLSHHRSEESFLDNYLHNADNLESLFNQLGKLREHLSEAWALARYGDSGDE